MKRYFSIIAIFVLLQALSSCKPRTTALPDDSQVKGVISQSPPGGTLAKRDLHNFDCDGFKEAVWYRMSKPVGAFIWHQYIGLRMTFNHVDRTGTVGLTHEFETSGLSDPSDLGNFKSWWQTKGESNKFAHMISSKRYTNCKTFLASAGRVNAAMASSRYQSVGIRVISMVIAPVPVLGGRPCAREAQSGTEAWLTGKDTDSAEYCDNCTEVMPGATWSKTSVDWEDTAFKDATSEGIK